MRLALTGGGTGGHVYPALEVGRLALEAGDEVRYFGSHRGIEGSAAAGVGMPFLGVEANPIPRIASLHGLKSYLTLLRSTKQVRRAFDEWRPDVLLATGGYSSAPALRAAKAAGVPIVLHEQNTVPGRAIRMMGAAAAKVCTVFRETYKYFPADKVIETGMPLRRELTAFAAAMHGSEGFTTLVVGGSQGARAVNDAVVRLAAKVGEDKWLHVSGPKLFDEVAAQNKNMPTGYKLESFLQAEAMAMALATSQLAIARSGCGTIAEFAMFGLPAIFVPLPTSFADHQLHNADEIASIGGGTVIEQDRLDTLESVWREWRADESRRASAAAALRSWAKPDAAERVLNVVKEAAL